MVLIPLASVTHLGSSEEEGEGFSSTLYSSTAFFERNRIRQGGYDVSLVLIVDVKCFELVGT